MSVLDVLLEGYNPAEARGRGGRWIRVGAHVTVHPYGHGIVTRVPSGTGPEKYGQHELATVKFDKALGQEGKSLVTRAQKLRPTSSSSRERGAAEVDAHMAAFKRGEVSRPRVRGDGRSGPIAPSSPAFDPVTSLGREGRAARKRGAKSATAEHADTRDKLANLPRGQRYGLHGPQGQVGHVERTAEGWHVVGSSGEPTTHKTPSSAAGAAMRIQRKAASSRENADVMARNYRGGREVERMNARQRQRAAAERLRSVREAQPMVLGALLEGH